MTASMNLRSFSSLLVVLLHLASTGARGDVVCCESASCSGCDASHKVPRVLKATECDVSVFQGALNIVDDTCIDIRADRILFEFPTIDEDSLIPGLGPDTCCSNNYKDCDQEAEWCQAAKENCEGNCNGLWIEVDHCDGKIARWGDCTTRPNDCCGPAVCDYKDDYYSQCL